MILTSRLSQFRSVADLKNTLLHEMIHAYINLTKIKDDGMHGSEFHRLMDSINESSFPDVEARKLCVMLNQCLEYRDLREDIV